MKNTKVIAFDMDGTIYDLYGQKGWLHALESEQADIFTTGQPMVNLARLKEVCHKLQNQGWTIGIITWLPKDATEKFNKECELSKQYWIEGNGLDFFQFFTAQRYGTDKKAGLPFRADINILVDDNKEARAEWGVNRSYQTIDATQNIIEELEKLLK